MLADILTKKSGNGSWIKKVVSTNNIQNIKLMYEYQALVTLLMFNLMYKFLSIKRREKREVEEVC